MKVLDLFSGIGGFSLGLERAGMETVAFCEIDAFCQRVLKKHWPNIPIYDDISKLDGKKYAGTIDLICGGFPCQPFSVAGKQKGKDDNRYLWPEMLRIIQESKPTWVIGENVPGIINLALEQVSTDLESEGYEVQMLIIPACAVNAPHRRSRVWIIAHTNGEGLSQWFEKSLGKTTGNQEPERLCSIKREWWEARPRVCGNDYGISRRVDRVRALGNAVVPQIPEILGKIIMEIENAPTKNLS